MPVEQHRDTRRIPGWERVLDAFMAAPDRILTNVQLAAVPGVQAFHQRLTDLGNYGYQITAAIKLAPGRYAYALLGINRGDAGWPFSYPRPHADALPKVSHTYDDYAVVCAAAVAKIDRRADELLKRDAVIGAPARADRDVARILEAALGEQHLDGWSAEDRGDALALARKAAVVINDARAIITSLQTCTHATGKTPEQESARQRLASLFGQHDATLVGDILEVTDSDGDVWDVESDGRAIIRPETGA